MAQWVDFIISRIVESNFVWVVIPIFFVGIITDKYQEEFGTSIGNAISNGALIIFTGFSWFEIISQRSHYHSEFVMSQFIFAFFIIIYGMSIIASGFRSGAFAKKYGRIRVVTFMLVFFTIMIYVPTLYNFFSILLFVFLFPFYYSFITELIKVMPSTGGSYEKQQLREPTEEEKYPHYVALKRKIHEYLYET